MVRNVLSSNYGAVRYDSTFAYSSDEGETNFTLIGPSLPLFVRTPVVAEAKNAVEVYDERLWFQGPSIYSILFVFAANRKF